MSQTKLSAVDEQERENKLSRRVEQLTGGRVVKIERQPRWRPAWFLEVETNSGDILKVHARGDRESDVVPFPELKREADILTVLEQHGIPVPHIYGMCDDPVAIIMATVPGTRDVAKAADDEQRRAIARQYIDAIAAMHKVPLAPFVERGVELPTTADEIALAGLKAYLPLYQKHKVKPEPLIEFAMRWLKSNVPAHRTTPGFIAFDAGQFLFENGKLTALYDFEFAMIGDPLTDLATMAMRQSHEPMGETTSNLCRYYAEVSGAPFDRKVFRYHHALFSTVACMQFVGAVSNPQPGDPHDVYSEWSLALRRSLLLVLQECMGVELIAPAAVVASTSRNATLMTMLADAVEHIGVADDMQGQRKNAARRLVEYLAKVDQYGAELERLERAEARQLLGDRYDASADLDTQMETFVQSAGPEFNQPLLQYFFNQITRRVQVYGETGIGLSAAHVRLEAIED